MNNLNVKDIIVYDLETTGLDERCDEILQLSIIDGDGDVLYNSYFKPEHVKEWARAEQCNHISPEMVKDKPYLKDEIDKILNIFKQAKLIVGYNQKGYDNKFLIHANSDFKTIFQSTPQRDVMLMYAESIGEWNDYFGSYKWHRLEDASKDLQYVNTDQFHNSLEDCKATLWVYNHLKSFEKYTKDEESEKAGSLLEHLLFYGYDPQDYIDALEELEELPRMKEQAEINPEGWDMEQISWIDGDIASDEEMISLMQRDWKPKGKPNMESEIAIIKKWLEG